MEHRTFDLRAEAACCVWEWMIERDRHNDNPALRKLFADYGTAEMRHVAIGLADYILDVYDLLGSERIEALNLIPYDWEFVPAVCRLVDWSCIPISKPIPTVAATMLESQNQGDFDED